MKTLDLESTSGDISIFIEPNEYQHPMQEKRTNGASKKEFWLWLYASADERE